MISMDHALLVYDYLFMLKELEACMIIISYSQTHTLNFALTFKFFLQFISSIQYFDLLNIYLAYIDYRKSIRR